MDGDDESVAGVGAAGGLALATLMLATMVTSIACVCLFPQIVTLSAEFGQPVNRVVWAMIVVDVIAVSIGGVAAALGAVLGNRRMLLLVLGTLIVGSVMAALSTSLVMLIAARAVQGVGVASQSIAFGIAAAYWRGEQRRRAMSMIILAMGAGAVVGYLMSGLIWKAGGDWRALFWVLLAAAGLNIVLALAFLRETPRSRGVAIDFVGCVGFIAWAVLLLVPLSQGNSWGWGSGRVVGLFLPGVAVLTLWVLWELRRPNPLLDLRLLRRMGVWQGFVVWVVAMIGLYVTSTTVPYLLQTPVASGFGFGKSIFAVSVALAVPAAAIMIFSPATTGLMGRYGARGTLLLGMLFGLAGFGLAFMHGSLWLILIWLAALGIPSAWGGAASYAVAAEAVSPEQGVIVGTLYNTAGAIGASTAMAIAGSFLTLREVSVQVAGPTGLSTQTFPAEQAFVWSSLFIGAVSVAGAACVLTIRPGELRGAGQESDAAAVFGEHG
jgi:MFS family permease